MPDSTAAKPSTSLAVSLAWLVVLIPAAWGVYNTVLKAVALFK